MEVKILILTGDAQLFLLLQHVLATEGFAASLVGSVEETLEHVVDGCVCAAIVDCSATAADPQLCHSLKRRRDVTVVLLCNRAAKAEDGPAATGDFDLVLEHPFDPALLVGFLRRLRLDTLIERGSAGRSDDLLCFADLQLNTATVRVQRNGSDVPLTALQFRLLRHLLNNPSVVQSREQLIAAAWPPDAEVDPRTVDIHIGHIRRALKMSGPDLIRTVRTLGYALDNALERVD